MKIFGGLALGALLWLIVLVFFYSPNIEYGGAGNTYDFETECEPIMAADGQSGFMGASGGVIETDVVRGEGKVEGLQDRAEEMGVQDRYFVQRQLDADCADRRARVLVWSQLAGMAFVICAVLAISRARRETQEIDEN